MSYNNLLLPDDNSIELLDNTEQIPGNDDGSQMFATLCQIQNLWSEMTAIRQNPSINDGIKDLELVRLIELHNKLDIQEQRCIELYTKSFVDSLKLYELGVQPTIQGGTKCSIQGSQPPSRETSFDDNRNPTHRCISQLNESRQEVVAQRKAEITKTLIQLNRRSYLTPEDQQLKASLMEELRNIH